MLTIQNSTLEMDSTRMRLLIKHRKPLTILIIHIFSKIRVSKILLVVIIMLGVT